VRARWLNYEDPRISHAAWTREESERLVALVHRALCAVLAARGDATVPEIEVVTIDHRAMGIAAGRHERQLARAPPHARPARLVLFTTGRGEFHALKRKAPPRALHHTAQPGLEKSEAVPPASPQPAAPLPASVLTLALPLVATARTLCPAQSLT
jgi:hypothetical protein